jgi:hypothetical protein
MRREMILGVGGHGAPLARGVALSAFGRSNRLRRGRKTHERAKKELAKKGMAIE